MIEAIAGIFGSGAFGAVTGLFGSWLTKREERKTMAVQQAHEAEMRKLDIEEAQAEHARAVEMVDKQIDQAVAEGEIAEDVAIAEAFSKSQEYGNKNTGTWADSLKGAMRPVITVYLLMIASFLAFKVNELTGGLSGINVDELISLYKQIVGELIFLTTTAVTWWFGARPSSRRKH